MHKRISLNQKCGEKLQKTFTVFNTEKNQAKNAHYITTIVQMSDIEIGLYQL